MPIPKRAVPKGKFPARLDLGRTSNFTVGHGFVGGNLYKPTTLPRLLRFVLPPFQRSEVWTDGQKSKFIESLWLGLPVSVYSYNQSPKLGKTDGWLIDGQQRWSAIRDFVDNKVVVFNDLRHSDMTVVEDLKFRQLGFPCILIESDDEDKLRDMYERLAYGGTAHT